jgi:chromosomal replication initiation ATPase DnaA
MKMKVQVKKEYDPFDVIKKIIEETFETSMETFRSESRKGHLVHLRKAFTVILRDEGISHQNIATFMNRTHATMINHAAKHLSEKGDKAYEELYAKAIKNYKLYTDIAAVPAKLLEVNLQIQRLESERNYLNFLHSKYYAHEN